MDWTTKCLGFLEMNSTITACPARTRNEIKSRQAVPEFDAHSPDNIRFGPDQVRCCAAAMMADILLLE